MSKELNFPLYRKYNGAEVWFKIVSYDAFLEIRFIGKKKIVTEILATQFPEKRFILDMIELFENRWTEADPNTIEKMLQEN